MSREKRVVPWSLHVGAAAVGVLFIAGCQRSTLPPLADDVEVSRDDRSAGQPLVIGEAVPRTVAPRTIAIDGDFEDWAGLAAVSVGRSTYEGSPYIRLGRVWTTFDDRWVYFRIELGRLVNVQGLTGTLSLQLDADGNRLTGDIRTGGTGELGIAGVDFELHFSPRGADGGFGGVGAEVVEANLPTAPANPYWFGASFAPTFASDEIELRMARGGLIPGATVMPFVASHFGARLVFTDEVGSIIDRTEPFSIALTPQPIDAPQFELGERETAELSAPVAETLGSDGDGEMAGGDDGENAGEPAVAGESSDGAEVTAAAAPPGRIARLNRGDVRAMSWNVLNGSIFANPGPFARVARALDPDIICFQELGSRTTPALLRSWLDEHLPSPFGWTVVISGEQGVGVATRLSAVPVTSLSGLVEPDPSNLRASSLLVAAADRRVLVTSVHLKCCGRAGDPSDQKRVAQADAIRRRLRVAQFDLSPSGLLIMGDLNLVGSYEPLQIILHQNDLNATDLLATNPFVIGDATNATWRDPQQPYLPGRLDYAVISDAVLRVSNCFLLDTERLSESERLRLGVESTDSAATDHLPIVVDFR